MSRSFRVALAALALGGVGGSCAPHESTRTPSPSGSATSAETTYAGSAACASCHAAIYERWKRTRMANVVRDPKVHPEAVTPDFTKPNPLVTFTIDDVAFVYGSKWKQRYFKRVGDDYYPLPAQWDVTHATWKPYFVPNGTDWWVPYYPADNMKRPTGPLCDGCHSVEYDVRTHAVAEWNVGCEKCHGPSSEHVRHPTRTNTINPARLDSKHDSDVCIQCHSQGRPLTNPIEGRYYDWAVGYRVGRELKEHWRLEEPEPGKTTFTHFPDGTAHKNRMQGNDFVQSVMYARGVTCANCHDVHGTKNDADLVAPAATLCFRCHAPGGPRGPRATTLEAHTHHRADSTGSACIACHMPKIAQTIGDVMVRSHTFRFIPPSATDQSKIPNPCTSCHADKTTAWATDAMKSWSAAATTH